MNNKLHTLLHHLASRGYTIGVCEIEPLVKRVVLKKRYKAWVFDGMTDSILIKYLARF